MIGFFPISATMIAHLLDTITSEGILHDFVPSGDAGFKKFVALFTKMHNSVDKAGKLCSDGKHNMTLFRTADTAQRQYAQR